MTAFGGQFVSLVQKSPEIFENKNITKLYNNFFRTIDE
jgi:hypothetical protein